MLRWRPIYLQCARNLFIDGKFEKLLWENLNKVLSVSPQKKKNKKKLEILLKFRKLNIKFINKNSIVINLNQPTAAGFYRFLVFEANSFF